MIWDFDWEGTDSEEAAEGGGGDGGAEWAFAKSKEKKLEAAEPTDEESDAALKMDGLKLERNIEEEEKERENQEEFEESIWD